MSKHVTILTQYSRVWMHVTMFKSGTMIGPRTLDSYMWFHMKQTLSEYTSYYDKGNNRPSSEPGREKLGVL